MTEKELRLMRGFINLSDTEKRNILREIEEYQKSDYLKRIERDREIRKKSSVGPKNTICDCCGR